MFHGSIVALVTPMFADGVVDIEALRQLVEWHIQEKTDAMVILGSTGEAATIHPAERKLIIQQTLEQTNRRIPVIVGTGTNSTENTIQLTKEAMELGADACLLVTPYYNKPTQEGLYQHYKAIANAVPIPQILYNVPSRTGCDLISETVGRLSMISNIIGIKEATGKLDRLQEIKEFLTTRFDLYSGDDASCLEFMLNGGCGVISVTANVAPRAMHEMYAAIVAGDKEQASGIQNKLMELHHIQGIETNPIPIKWALHRMGMIQSGIRMPLLPLSEKHRYELERVLQQAGIEIK